MADLLTTFTSALRSEADLVLAIKSIGWLTIFFVLSLVFIEFAIHQWYKRESYKFHHLTYAGILCMILFLSTSIFSGYFFTVGLQLFKLPVTQNLFKCFFGLSVVSIVFSVATYIIHEKRKKVYEQTSLKKLSAAGSNKRQSTMIKYY